MTALANSPAFWSRAPAAHAALYVLPAMIAVIRHAENIALMVFFELLSDHLAGRRWSWHA